MILLLGTTDSLAVITGSGVANIDMHCSYMDYNAGTVTPGSTNTVVSTAATTTVAAAPGSGVQRNVKCLIVHNTHATSPNLITVQVVSGATAVIYAYNLLAGETLQYYDTLGFEVLDASGGLKLSPAAGRLLKRSVVTSGTTFTSQVATTTLTVRAVGGGGGGAGCTSVASAASAGGGGGAGAYCEKTYTGQVGNKTFTIAIGGLGAGNSGAAGGNGGNTTFTDGTTLITAPGGTGAVVATAVTTVGTCYAGGTGGTVATNGDLNSGGMPEQPESLPL